MESEDEVSTNILHTEEDVLLYNTCTYRGVCTVQDMSQIFMEVNKNVETITKKQVRTMIAVYQAYFSHLTTSLVSSLHQYVDW